MQARELVDGQARLEQPLAAVRLRDPAAERADVERVAAQRGGERRHVELVVVREHDHRRVAVELELRERLLGPGDDDLLGARHPLGGREARPRVDADRVPAERPRAAQQSASPVSTAPTTTSRGGRP